MPFLQLNLRLSSFVGGDEELLKQGQVVTKDLRGIDVV